MDDLPDILQGYEIKDVFNCDETVLYSSKLPRNLLSKLETLDTATRSKRSGSRSCCAVQCMGEEKLLMIGKSKKLQILKGADFEKLPVIYRSQKSAWMIGLIFEEWLKAFDKKMYAQGRKVLLTLDNAGVHNLQEIKLTAVKLLY